jgi:ABC-type dipeptide/oligopeptide/nickel transport system permease subunit
MLVTGLVITAAFILVALFAPLIAPYTWAQQQTADGMSFGTQQAPNSLNLLGTTVSGFDVLSRVLWGAQTALLVLIAAIVCSICIGFMLAEYLKSRDFVAVQGIVVKIAVVVAVTNFIGDIVAAFIDPRVRY